MKLNKTLIPIGALVMAVGAGGLSADAAPRSKGRNRGATQNQDQVQRSGNGQTDDQRTNSQNGNGQTDDQRTNSQNANAGRGGQRPNSQGANVGRDGQRAIGQSANAGRGGQRAIGQSANAGRGDQRAIGQSANVGRGDARGRDGVNRSQEPGGHDFRSDRGTDHHVYPAPRLDVRRPAPRHHYGSGGNFSVYFAVGSGYRYGAPYSGRVYGYAPPAYVYGTPHFYGDVRLQVRPRNAAVYVDGYYAGIVDNFDGAFQRLTLEVGPHRIEIAAPGLEPWVFDVYVDPARTVDLRGDLVAGRPY